ncbi:hypothetical protein NM208_g4766 [Fusarium decemcellulare]|uniref:Uncharacterized protein n=1 Tax=Fusarium decemcellulare TaxID=57161 RepID=A0ACC1SJV1_9HYPO|nr:hypothetical protein NM208_g4766 [Fusarium decemcellulare]
MGSSRHSRHRSWYDPRNPQYAMNGQRGESKIKRCPCGFYGQHNCRLAKANRRRVARLERRCLRNAERRRLSEDQHRSSSTDQHPPSFTPEDHSSSKGANDDGQQTKPERPVTAVDGQSTDQTASDTTKPQLEVNTVVSVAGQSVDPTTATSLLQPKVDKSVTELRIMDVGLAKHTWEHIRGGYFQQDDGSSSRAATPESNGCIIYHNPSKLVDGYVQTRPIMRDGFKGDREFRSRQYMQRLVVKAFEDEESLRRLLDEEEDYEASHLCSKSNCIAPWHITVEKKAKKYSSKGLSPDDYDTPD